jgi:hypothetical protein
MFPFILVDSGLQVFIYLKAFTNLNIQNQLLNYTNQMNYKLKFSSLFYTTNSYVVNGLDIVPVGSIPTNNYLQKKMIKKLFQGLYLRNRDQRYPGSKKKER